MTRSESVFIAFLACLVVLFISGVALILKGSLSKGASAGRRTLFILAGVLLLLPAGCQALADTYAPDMHQEPAVRLASAQVSHVESSLHG